MAAERKPSLSRPPAPLSPAPAAARQSTLATLATLYARMSPGTRTAAALTTVMLAAGKLLAVLVALRVADGDARGATMVGAFAVVVFALTRGISSNARVNAECDIHRVVARSLLEGDVLDTATVPPLRVLFAPTVHVRTLVTETAPDLLAGVIAALVAAPLVAATLPARVLVVSAVAVVAVIGALLLLGRTSGALQRRVYLAQEKAHERSSAAIDGRLELVARGAHEAALRSLDDALGEYQRVARSAAWSTALLGRAPLAAGLAAVVVAVVLDASYREAVTAAVLGRALALAACLPILLGVVMRANELTRLSAMVSPVLDVLAVPPRPELARKGTKPPRLPAAMAARDVSFSYGAGAPATLEDLSLEWPAGGALFIEGPNGAGKSTLLRLLLGLRAPDQGSLTVGGIDLAKVDLPALRKGIAYLPQRPYLGETYHSVRNVLRVFDESVSDDAMTAALERVGLGAARPAGELLDTPVSELSAGQRQRLALARVLLQDASIYLLDEPDANLDRAGIVLVGEIVQELVARGRMVAVAAHTSELAAIAGTRLTLT